VVVKGLNGPCGLAFDSSGRLYVVERWAHIVSRYDTVAGTSSVYAGIRNNYGFSGDGGLAVSAQFDQPMGIAFNASGNLYIAVAENNCVRMVNTAGYISTAAGVGEVWGNTGNGASATLAKFGNPADVAIGPDGDIYVSDTGNAVVRRVKASNGNIYAFAGTGTSGYSGDGGLAVSATLKLSLAAGTSCGSGIDVDNSGNVYIADTGNHVVRRVDALTGFITTIAGTGTASYGTGEGVATSVGLTDPTDVLVADDGTIYITDCYQVTTSVYDSVSKTWNNVSYNRGRVCSVSGGRLTNLMTSYDTNSVDRFSPSSLAMSPAGVLHVTDMNNGTVVRVK
jgi:sugar lactone lactonase YvrE